MEPTCWGCGQGPTIVAEAHPEYPIVFCFGCGQHSTNDLAAMASTSE